MNPDWIEQRMMLAIGPGCSLEKSKVTIAASGTRSSTLPAATGEPDQKSRPIRMPARPSRVMASALLQQHVEIGGGLLSQVFGVLRKESIGAMTAVFLEHGNEFPFGVQL